MKKVKRALRFVKLYGIRRTAIKIAGRTGDKRLKILFPLTFMKGSAKSISLIGCGQFGFSTISYFLYLQNRGKFLECYDILSENSIKAARFWGYRSVPVKTLLANPDCRLVYIASNHASHTDYAVDTLAAGLDVYVEKPVSVSRVQLNRLCTAVKAASGSIYVGYNRPFSKAITEVSKLIKGNKAPLSLSCFVIGHFIDEDHWYRNPEEGTRVCGNMGHWIDLAVHLMIQRGVMPGRFDISIAYGSEKDNDDNVVVNFATDFGDIITFCLTSRKEPFEGINETINLQSEGIISKIDDFRSMQVWRDDVYTHKRYWPKDVGHKSAIEQPFRDEKRDFKEVVLSSLLMLEVMGMVQKRINQRIYAPLEDELYKNYIA